jgi:hypothetical protein
MRMANRPLSLSTWLILLVCGFSLSASAHLIDLYYESPHHQAIGANAEDRAGTSVLLGDVDGDGLDDVIFGAPEFDLPGRGNCGAVFVWLSSDTIPDSISVSVDRADVKRIFGPAPNSRLGDVLACGDINNDGRAEILCGVPAASPLGRFFAGEIHVIFGSATPADTTDLASPPAGVTCVLGAAVFDQTGSSIAVGDVTDDTFGDILAGAPLATTVRSLTGKAIVIHGSASPPDTIDLADPPQPVTHLFGRNTNDFFGAGVLAADVTGDLIADIIVGAPEASPLGRTRAGVAYVIPGGSSLADTIDTIDAPAGGIVQIFGEENESATGSAFAVGDLDGDTNPELCIGAPEFASNAGGAVYVVAAGGIWPDTLDLAGPNPPTRVDGNEANANVGLNLAAGDLNQDGMDDLVIGAPLARPYVGRDEGGKVYIVFGRASFPPTLDLAQLQAGMTHIYGAGAFHHTGSSVAVGRIDPGGFWDLLFGVEQIDDGGGMPRVGAGYVILGGNDITPTAVLSYTAEYRDHAVHLGWYLAEAVATRDIVVERVARGVTKHFEGTHVYRSDRHYTFSDAGATPGETYTYRVLQREDDLRELFAVVVPVAAVGRPHIGPVYPNPFRDATDIRIELSTPGAAELTIYNVAGARVRRLASGALPKGPTILRWDGRNDAGQPVPSGVYFVRLSSGGHHVFHKLMLLK